MPQNFIHEDFLLDGMAAKTLFHDYAADCPIIDYHNHLLPGEIADDQQFENLTEVWLAGDHYKWRLMRANGIPERLITGDADPRDKFDAWAATVPATLGNPLYHWTHMELANPFGIRDSLLNRKTAPMVWEHCNEMLQMPEFSCRSLLKRRKVKLLCTTDDPADDLLAHQEIAKDRDFEITVLPTFRPDRAMAIDQGGKFREFVGELTAVTDKDIRDYSSFLEALKQRHDYFHQMGCRLADHGLGKLSADDFTETALNATFEFVLSGNEIDEATASQFRSALLYQFGVWAHEKNWTQQYHIGPLRNVNSRLFNSVGPDSGGDTMNNQLAAQDLATTLDRLNASSHLPRTIIYSLNPNDLEMIVAMAGSFQTEEAKGKIQSGAAWWFNDHEDGILRHFSALANIGLLSNFVGMLTDSRSFLSFSRHEYFRRILCSYLGQQVDSGRLPNDLPLIGETIKDIAYRNARSYFGFEEVTPPL